jgi:hypothetical protein
VQLIILQLQQRHAGRYVSTVRDSNVRNVEPQLDVYAYSAVGCGFRVARGFSLKRK